MTVKEYATKRRINEADVESIASLYNVFIHNGNISDEDITKLDNSFHLHRNNLNNMIFDMKSAEISYINGVVKEYEDVLNFATDDNVKVYAQKYIERFQKIKEQRVGRLEMTSTLINHNISSYANISDEANPLTNEITRSKVRNLEQQLEAIIGPQGTLVAEERKKSELEKVLEGAKHFKKIRQMQLDTSKKKIEKLRYSATTIKSRQTSLINKNLSAYYARVNNKFKKLEEKASRDLRAVERYNRVVKKVNYADTQLSEIIGDSLIEKAKRRYFKTVKFCEQNKLDFIVGWNELLKRDLQAVPVPQVKPIITTPQFSPVIQTSPAIQTQSVNTQEKEKREALLAQIQKVGLLNQTQNTQDNKHQAMIDQINASKEKASQITRAKTNYETVIDELIKSDSVIQDRISAIQELISRVRQMDDANEYVNKVIHGQSVDQIASSNMPSVSDKEGSLKEATKTIITVPSIEPNINNTLKNEEKVKEIGPQEIKAIGDNNQNKHRFTNLLITKTPVPGSLLVKAGKAYKVLENQKLEQFSSPSRATILDQKFAKGLENMTQEELEKLKLVKDFSPRDLGYIDGLIERKRSATEEKLSM